jgi:regulator of RNase E activity RraA
MRAGEPIIGDLQRYDSPTLSNAIETFDVRPRAKGFMSSEIRCMFPTMPVVAGYAATATFRTARPVRKEMSQSIVWKHVAKLPLPRILVLEDLDNPPGKGAQIGEVQATIYKALGCIAIITNGVVRDLTEVEASGMQLFAAGSTASHANAHFTSAGGKVTVGGLTVSPGDLIHADRNGVLLIPVEIAPRLAQAADRIIAREQRVIRWIRSYDFDVSRLEEMRVPSTNPIGQASDALGGSDG